MNNPWNDPACMTVLQLHVVCRDETQLVTTADLMAEFNAHDVAPVGFHEAENYMSSAGSVFRE